MEPFTLDILPDESVIALTLTEAYRPAQHFDSIVEAQFVALDSVDTRCYIIVDLNDVKLGLPDMMVNLGKIGSVIQRANTHPNYIMTVYVASGSGERMLVNWLGRELFGRHLMKLFDTYDDALGFVRTRVT